ncbi:M13 family metallopeptidase [Sphingopyxis sp. XHP0097]|uniref:M13 family metallopeptidase n=1 Tax=Sphingopyxis jiangsuensis TaxID=2871171 RepID=A0ABS7MCR7_9SPHN|nr:MULTISPECIES: M13 family metallopeptidase [Sphingopyxis]MBY4636748.1 M13 family metallopeptidase [Sphingopyxis jiangsuensis]
MRHSVLAVLLATTAIAVGTAACTSAEKESVYTVGTELGISKTAMDTSVNPGDDFYAYANGNWQKTTEIPADRSSIGSFYIAFLETEKRNRELVEAILKGKPAEASNEARIASFYNAYMDTAAIDAAGMKPVEADLARFSAIADKAGLAKVLGEQARVDVDPLNFTDFHTENLFGLFVTQGLSTPGEVLPYMLQGGLGLPEREYYLSDDPKMGEIRAAYRAYIVHLLTLSGIADAEAKAARIYDLETKIARAHAPREESEDFTKSATVWTRADFDKKAPGLDWQAYFASSNLGKAGKFAAYHPAAITRLSKLVASEPLDAWKDWLAFHQINMHTDVLPTKLDQAHFAFYGTTLSGTPEQRSRDKRALAALNQYLGDAVGKAYADKYFPAAAKAEVGDMVEGIKTAFAKRVETIDWMAPATKKEAIKKVETIVVGVGYPDTWRDYGRFNVGNSAYANAVAGEKAETAHQLAKIGKPMDRDEWWMTPQTVNAINLPVQNALNFPAAILQPPFFNPKADPAYNYGAIGAVIGHEISHSFDNNGAAFDSTGALRNWWTDADLRKFEEAGQALAEQYDQYKPFPDLAINGKLTLGENIADVAGLQAAYDAYRASLGGKEAPVIDGFTGDQRFFIAFAQTWATKMRDAALRQRVATDGHAPGMYRALTVRNLDAWYKAFDVKPTDKLYLPPEKRVRVWG